MQTISIKIPEEVEVGKARMIIASSLFDQGILSSGQAAELAGVSRRTFIEQVGKFGISVFGETVEDIENIDKIEL